MINMLITEKMNKIKINRAHKIRLCPNNIQANYFERSCGVARVTYNWGIKEWKRQYDNGEKPSAYGLNKQFNGIKRNEFPFVIEVTKCVPQQAFVNLETAFTNFFRDIKKGKKNSYPRFKKRGKHDSFGIANDKFRIDENKIRIPKSGISHEEAMS